MTVNAIDGGVEIYDGETLVAIAAPVDAIAPAPAPVTPDEAAAAEQDPHQFAEGCEFPTCFGCGHERADGLRLFAGPVGDGRFAARWIPKEPVDDLLVWAALDCPSGAAVWDRPGPPMLLGRFAVHAERPVEQGAPHAIVSQEIERDGRKRRAAVALYDQAGTRLAHGEALWIAIRTS